MKLIIFATQSPLKEGPGEYFLSAPDLWHVSEIIKWLGGKLGTILFGLSSPSMSV